MDGARQRLKLKLKLKRERGSTRDPATRVERNRHLRERQVPGTMPAEPQTPNPNPEIKPRIQTPNSNPERPLGIVCQSFSTFTRGDP